MEKLKISYPIIVEGRYDKIKLASVVDAYILTTEGFRIFKNSEKMAIIRRLAKNGKIIVLTDSDGAGKVIRSHITSCVPKDRIINLYTPQIKGREKRKAHNSAEGFLGVEGAAIKILYEMLSPFATDSESSSMGCNITKLDFYNDGLTGKDNSKENRNKVARYLGLPADMTPNALLSAIQVAYTLDEYKSAVEKLIGD